MCWGRYSDWRLARAWVDPGRSEHSVVPGNVRVCGPRGILQRLHGATQNKWYADILAPFRDPYHTDHKSVGAPFDIKTKNGPNQGAWIDVYIPKDARPGRYSGPIRITVNGKLQYTASLQLTVHDFTIPDETHVDGYGEFYGLAYEFHHALYAQAGVDKWWEIAKRYHQMAHQHRFVVMERRGIGRTSATA